MAHFEIHVLNYNGLRYLERCLTALSVIDTGDHVVHVNVVDNGSTDDSASYVQTHFPKVSFLRLGKNYGFTGGNNQGAFQTASLVKAACGREHDYDVFLNNDTAVTKNWLIEAAAVLEREPTVGIVGSKALFMDRFVAISVRVTPPFRPSDCGSADTRTLGSFLQTPVGGVNIKEDPARIRWKGAFGQEQGGRWLGPDSTIYLPVADELMPSSVSLSFRTLAEQGSCLKFDIFINGRPEAAVVREVVGGAAFTVPMDFTTKDYVSVVQNLGNFITPAWEAGDCGFGQIDSGNVESPHPVSAVCGVSMFIRHTLFRRLGGFDPRYFAYFEDADLSVRAYLAGYTCKVVPNSVLYHLHCGSSGGEWSPTFSRLVAYSHLLFMNKFAPPQLWARHYAELQRAARKQFEVFLQTQDLDATPQLRAYLALLKKPHIFVLNRLRYRWLQARLAQYPFSGPEAPILDA